MNNTAAELLPGRSTGIAAYLDRTCTGLSVNPAQIESIREELSAHLEELIGEYRREGMPRRQAVAAALREFGEADEVRGWLAQVHRGDPWWLLRLKGMGLGMLLGALLCVVLPLAGHVEPLAARLSLLLPYDPCRAQAVLNGLLVGGLVGLMCAGGRWLHAACLIGALVWLGEYVVYSVVSLAHHGPVLDGRSGAMNGLLLAPVVGTLFALIVGASSAAILSLLVRRRPALG